jgi:cyclophilin family peptidyl-prolyl cis-trans isomerase/formylglycine-generating enzyme required for sulfatase activity
MTILRVAFMPHLFMPTSAAISRVALWLTILGLFSSTALALPPAAPTIRSVKMTIPSAASKANFSLLSGTTFFLVEWDDHSADENFFEVQLRIAPNIQTSFLPLTYPDANETSFLWVIDLSRYSIQQGQLVEFRVAACKGLRTSDSVATVSERSALTTIGSVPYDSIAEASFSAPSVFSAALAPNSDGLLRMSWTDNSDKEETNEVFVKRTTDSSYPTSPYLTFGNFYFGRNPPDSAALLKPGASYNLKLRARRSTAWGLVSGQTQPTTNDYTGYSNEQTITIPALKPHTALVASAVDENTLKLDWADNSDNETLTSIEYRIPSGSGLYQSLGTVNPNSTSAGSVTFDHLPGLATDWQVKAGHQEGSNAADYAAASNSVTYTLPFNPPTNLQASVAGNPTTSQSVVSLSWADNSAVETGYLIFARTTTPANGTYAVVKTVPTVNATSTTVESGFLPGTSYDFQVRAYFDNGTITTQSNPSNTVLAASKDGFTGALYAPITLGQTFSYQVATTTLSARTGWTVTGLPLGLIFNSSNGQVTGTPAEAGLFECPMTASFADGWIAKGTLVLRVLRPPAVPEKPVTITARTLPVGSVNVPLSMLFSDLDTEAAVRMSTTVGNVDIVLQPTLTPQTYANFMAYANDPDAADNYNNAVFHRVSPGFVVQGGGYKPTPAQGADAFTEVTRKASPINEAGISNVAGTISLAKSTGVNSGTHDFFFNVGNNSSLDTVANNSFTAFGRVAGNGMSTTVQNIINLPGQQYTVRIKSSGGTTFESSDPLSGNLGSGTRWPINDSSAPTTMDNSKVVKINSITSLPVLTYAITLNSDPGNVAANIIGSNLVLQGIQDATTSTITLAATDVDGNVTEQTFLVTVQGGFEAPQIATQPQAQTVPQGDDVIFSVIATGSGPLEYQWRKNGKNIAGQTGSSLALQDVTAADIADYSVVVSNGATFIFSNSVHLTVNIPVSITADPISITRNYGSSATFTVSVTGDAPLSYQWMKGETNIPLATSATYTINNLLMADAGNYKVKVTNNVNDVTSAAAVLTVNPVDTDNDGLYDHVELASSPVTTPTDADTDDDGFVDGLEVGAGTNPTVATSKPGSTIFYAQKEATSVLGGIAMKRTLSGNILNRLDNNNNVVVPELWLATYELTNQQFASVLQRAKELDLILIADESGRRVVRYPKVAGEIVCYLANPSGQSPESTDVDLDSIGSSFILPVAKVLEPASAISWYGAYLCTVVLNQVHGYTGKNVPSSWSYSSVNGYQIPDYTAWELAARGGSALPPLFGQLYPTGSTISTAKANYNNAATGAAKKTGSFAVGKLGLYDMAGNVAEWVFQPASGNNGYLRGGSFADPETKLRNSSPSVDDSIAKTTISRRVGVRLALQAGAAASFVTHPLAQFQRTDVPLTLTATATGAPPLAYQWYKNNVAIKGKTGSTLTIPSPVLADAGEYHVTVTTNGINAVPSNKAKVALVQAFTVPPLTTIAATKGASFEAKAQGAVGQTFTYQWKLGTTNIPLDTQFINPVVKKLVMNNMQPGNSAVYTCEVKLAGQTALPAVTTQFELLVMQTPEITAFNLPDGIVSGSYNYTLPQNSDETKGATSWTVTGLPAGMTYNAATGVISGKPTAGGDTFKIKITAKNIFGQSSTIEENLKIYFPDGNSYGTFFGVVDRHVAPGINDNLGGRLDVNIAGTGKLTGSINLGTKLHRFTGTLDNVVPVVSGNTVTYQNPSVTVLIPRTGLPKLRLAFTIRLSDKTLINATVGELGAGGSAPTTTAAITGWRNTWNKLINSSGDYQAKRNVAFTIPVASIGVAGLPQGASYATVTVDDAGNTTISGKLADNTVLTSTGYLSPTGRIAHFQLLYAGKGSVVGTFNTAPFTHVVTGTDTLSWLHKDLGAASKDRNYKRGYSTTLTAQGGVYTVPGAGSIIAGLDAITGSYPQNARLIFNQGGIAIATNSLVAGEFTQKFVITTSNIVQMPTTALDNPQIVSFTPTPTTGAITGSFTVVNDDPTSLTVPKRQITRKVTYYGLIVPTAGQPTKGVGYGYFTMYGLPASGGVTTSNSDILSGKMVFDAAPVPPPVP